mmetsp:Transcript_47030/g.109801  ORF Transcript_47030/g.109801 Transcript_47030/m.109801 type:complete len:218 (-) Transcript_47030:389-1042(-)
MRTCTRRSGRRRRQSGWLRRARRRRRSGLGAARLRPTSQTTTSSGADRGRVRVEPGQVAAALSSAQHPSRLLRRRCFPPAGRGRNQLAGAALAHEAVADCAHRAARATARGVRQAPRDAGEVRGVAPHLARYRAHRAQRTNQCTLRGACAPPRARHSTIMAQREALKLLEDRLWQAGQSIVSGIDTGDALLQASHAAELAEQEGWNKVIGIGYSTKQ